MKKAVPEWTCYLNNLSFLARLWERIKPGSSFSYGPQTDKTYTANAPTQLYMQTQC